MPNSCIVCGQPPTSRNAKYCDAPACQETRKERTRAAIAAWWEQNRMHSVTHGGEAGRKRGEAISQSNQKIPRRRPPVFSQNGDCCGFWLAQYAEREGLTGSQLAAFLRCSSSQLQQLAACPYPRGPTWDDEVRDLAATHGADATRLSRALIVDDFNA